MHNLVSLEPIDYLMIGHVAHDLTPDGWRLGGTTAYSALTARALGLRVGILTAAGPETSLDALQGIPVVSLPSPQSTMFENIYTDPFLTFSTNHLTWTYGLPRMDYLELIDEG